jgi:hypothetical protein
MKTTLIFLLCILSLNSFAKRGASKNNKPIALNEFTTDGCSAYPDGYAWTQEYEWIHCCFAHDISYWVGGTHEEKVAADAELNRCVSEASFNAHGRMMEMGVATGGTPHVATTWRWGYGWSKMVTYKELTSEKIKMIDEKAHTILNALSLESLYMNDAQVDYVMEKFDQFREANLKQLEEI